MQGDCTCYALHTITPCSNYVFRASILAIVTDCPLSEGSWCEGKMHTKNLIRKTAPPREFLLQGNYHIYKFVWFLIDESTQHFGFLLLWERYRLVYCFKVGFVRSFWSNFASRSQVFGGMEPQNEAIAGLECKSEYHKASIVNLSAKEQNCSQWVLSLFSLKQWVLCWTSLIDLYDSILALDLKCTVTSITLLCT